MKLMYHTFYELSRPLLLTFRLNDVTRVRDAVAKILVKNVDLIIFS